MGRYCGDLAVYAAVATGADIVITRENPMTDEELFEQVKLQTQVEHKRHLIILVTEHIYNVAELADRISKECGVEAKSEVLGRIQRGGIPSALDRFFATAMGVKAIDELLRDKTGICIGLINNEIVSTPIEEALQMVNKSNKEFKHVLVRSR
jgi:6-phosphofructokinase 1